MIAIERLREIGQIPANGYDDAEKRAMAAELLAAREVQRKFDEVDPVGTLRAAIARADGLAADLAACVVRADKAESDLRDSCDKIIPVCDLCGWEGAIVRTIAESSAIVRGHLDHCPEMAKRIAPAIARAEKAEAERDAARVEADDHLGALRTIAGAIGNPTLCGDADKSLSQALAQEVVRQFGEWPEQIAAELGRTCDQVGRTPSMVSGAVSMALGAARAEVERLRAASATLAAVCKALGCDVDSVRAQAAMFREKATTLPGQLESARAEIARLNADLAASQRAAEIARSECQAEVDRARAELVAERAAAERAAALWQKRIERLLDFPMVVVNGADVSDELEQMRTRAEAAEQELAELRQPAKPDRAASDAEGDGA